MQWWLNIRKSICIVHHINRVKKKNYMVISLDAMKVFEKIQHLFLIKIVSKYSRYIRELPQLDLEHLQ